jgi:S-adenosylmethionine synthetase
VACETAATTGLVMVLGEITTSCYVDMPRIIRGTIKEIGYTSASYGFDYETTGVAVSIKEQSPDISRGVDRALEIREGGLSEDELEQTGAGDQGMMIGFACNETPELMPLPISLAHQVSRRLATVRKNGALPYLRPDGKSQVTVEYAYGKPVRVDTVVVSTQHAGDIDLDTLLKPDVEEHVVAPVLAELDLDSRGYRLLVNPTGRFEIGGPMGDAGLTGRKIIVDTYGGMARHGGGAFSGNEPTKVDRSAAYAARYVAKNIVAAGLADRCEIQVSYAIGVARPLSLFVETFGTGKVSDEELIALIREHFDLRPAGIIQTLDLRRPIYQPTAAFGHFGRTDIDAPWERLDKVDVLRRAVGETVATGRV